MRKLTNRVSLLLVAAILVVLNLIGLNWFGRLDLTDDRVFTLAAASQNMVQGLKDPLTVKVYFTDNLPAPYGSNRRMLRDKLNEYRAYSSNFQYQFLDPNTPKDKDAAEKVGIPPVQVQVVENDNLQVKNAFMGLTVEYGGKSETLPVIQDLSNLEYDLSTAIRKLTSPSLPKIGFLTGQGEPSPTQALQFWRGGLEKSYQTLDIRIDSTGQFSEKPDVLMVVAPTEAFRPAALQALDQFIMQGGKVGFLVNKVQASIQSGTGAVEKTGLDQLLNAYGLVVQANLVQDRQSAPVTAQNGPFTVQIPYDFLPIATKFAEHPITNGLREMLLPFVSNVDVSKAKPGIKATPLVFSSPNSRLVTDFSGLRPDPNATPNQALTGGPYTLAATYEGRFSSAFAPSQKSKETRLLLLGDGDFVNEQIVGQPPEGNLVFAMNAIDWLLQDQTLASIRAKTLQPRALDPVSDATKGLIKWFAILFPAFLVIGIGLFRWRIRKGTQFVLAEKAP